MAKILSKDIGDFLQFDESVSDTNAYINVRDMWTFKRNHNSLLAKTMRRCLGTFTFQENGKECIIESPEFANSIISENAVPIFRMRAPISGHTKKIGYWFRAQLNSVTYAQEVRLYVVVSDPRQPRNISRSSPVTYDTHGVVAEKAGFAFMPYFYRIQHGGTYDYEVALHMLPEITTTNILVGTASISASTTTSVTCTAASLANVTVGDIIEPLTQEKRVVKNITTISTNKKLDIYGSWPAAPIVRLDHAAHVPTITIESVSIYELETTAFDLELDRI